MRKIISTLLISTLSLLLASAAAAFAPYPSNYYTQGAQQPLLPPQNVADLIPGYDASDLFDTFDSQSLPTGYSRGSSITLRLAGDLMPEPLALDGGSALIQVGLFSLVDHSRIAVRVQSLGDGVLTVTPQTLLTPGHDYLFVVTRHLPFLPATENGTDSSGNWLRSTPLEAAQSLLEGYGIFEDDVMVLAELTVREEREVQQDLTPSLQHIYQQTPALKINRVEPVLATKASTPSAINTWLHANLSALLLNGEIKSWPVRIAIPHRLNPAAPLAILNIGSNEEVSSAQAAARFARLGYASIQLGAGSYQSAKTDRFTQALNAGSLDAFIEESAQHAQMLTALLRALPSLTNMDLSTHIDSFSQHTRLNTSHPIMLNVGYAGALALPFIQLADSENWGLHAAAFLDVNKKSLSEQLLSTYYYHGHYARLIKSGKNKTALSQQLFLNQLQQYYLDSIDGINVDISASHNIATLMIETRVPHAERDKNEDEAPVEKLITWLTTL